ncbi:MAG: hypothetical protein MUF19_02760 [Candidatus Pacebacteria bacterium]|jgi:hypothetical protein|nr:hypothetical protein [Candidatus Paceibacterota bacterium]
MDKIKIYNIVGLSIVLMVYLAGYVFWENYCIAGECSYDLRNNVLRPISLGSLYLGILLLGLLLIPSRYFKNWFKYIFSWGFPLSVYMTYITTGSSSIPAYGKVDVVRFWGMFFIIATVIFVSVLLYWDWKKKRGK